MATRVAEILGHRHAGQANAQTSPRRLIHLSKYHRGLGDYAGLRHLTIEVVSFTRTLADTRKDRVATVLGSGVADELLNDDGLSYAGAAEDPDLSPLAERSDQVNDFEASLEDLRSDLLLIERGGRSVDWVVLVTVNVALEVDGLPKHVEESPQRFRAHRDRDRRACVDCFHAAGEAIRGGHSNGTDPVVPQMLLGLQDERRSVLAVHLDRVVDLRKVVGGKLDVDHRADDLDDSSFGSGWHCSSRVNGRSRQGFEPRVWWDRKEGISGPGPSPRPHWRSQRFLS